MNQIPYLFCSTSGTGITLIGILYHIGIYQNRALHVVLFIEFQSIIVVCKKTSLELFL